MVWNLGGTQVYILFETPKNTEGGARSPWSLGADAHVIEGAHNKAGGSIVTERMIIQNGTI